MITSIDYNRLDDLIIQDLSITNLTYYTALNRDKRNILRRYYYALTDLSFINWYNISDNSLNLNSTPEYSELTKSLIEYDYNKKLEIDILNDTNNYNRYINTDSSKNFFTSEYINLNYNSLIGIRLDMQSYNEITYTIPYNKEYFFGNRDYSGNYVDRNDVSVNDLIADISTSLIDSITERTNNGSRYIRNYNVDLNLANVFLNEISNNLIDYNNEFTIISLQNKNHNISSFEIVFEDFNIKNKRYLDDANPNNKWCLYKDLGTLPDINDLSFISNGDKTDITFNIMNPDIIGSDISSIIMYREAINDSHRWSGYYTNLHVGLPAQFFNEDVLTYSGDVTIPVTFIPNNEVLMRGYNSSDVFGIKDISYSDRNTLYNISDSGNKIDNKNSCFYRISDASNVYHNILVLAGRAKIKKIQNVFDNSYIKIDDNDISFQNISEINN